MSQSGSAQALPTALGVSRKTSPNTPSITDTLQEYGRGIVGGLIFAFAPLYTMEMWWQGFLVPPYIILLAMGATYLILVAYAYYVGIHEHRSLTYNLAEALESLAIGFGVALVVLLLLGQLPAGISFHEALSKLTIEGLSCAVGVAVGSSQLGGNHNEDEEGEATEPPSLIHELAYTTLGCILLVAGFTPTVEIMTIGIEAPAWAVLATALLSLLMAFGITSFINFRGSYREKEVYAGGPWGAAFVTYAIGLLIAGILLWSVGRFEGVSLPAALSMTVYLAWPTTLGGAAGRFLL